MKRVAKRVHTPKLEETVHGHFWLGVFLGIVSLFTLTSAPVFAGHATLSGTSDAIGQRVVPLVSHVKEPVLAGSASIPGIPEPGVVAALGCSLLILGLASWSSRRMSRLSRPTVARSGPERLGTSYSSNNVDEVTHVG